MSEVEDNTPTPPPPTEFKVGDRVNRLEDREVTGATVISVRQAAPFVIIELAYDEGGSGFWTSDSLSLIA